MSKNCNTIDSVKTFERPPLPPKSTLNTCPPLPPKQVEWKEDFQNLKKEKPIDRKKSSSKDVIINNNSYSLSKIEDDICDKYEKIIEKKEVYENYKPTNDSQFVKKKSFMNKIKNLLKKSKNVSESNLDENITDHIPGHVDNNRYKDIPDNCSSLTCPNCCYCSHCQHCSCLFPQNNQQLPHNHHHYQPHCHHHLHHRLHHHHHHHHRVYPIRCEHLSNLSDWNHGSSCNILLSENIEIPIIPNRTKTEIPPKIRTPQICIEELEQKAFEPVIPSPMEKYSRNFLTKNLLELKKVGWYWGSISSDEAENVMAHQPNGTFLVRDSAHSDHLFSVTFRVNSFTYHSRIQFSQNRFWWNRNNQDDGFDSITELIQNSIEISKRGECRYFENTDNVNVPPYAVSLLHPLSRLKLMSSLKHLARFVIISNVRSDHLQLLRLPRHLLLYLYDKEHHFIEDFNKYLNMVDNNQQ